MAKSKDKSPRVKLSILNYMAGGSLTSVASSTTSSSGTVRIVQERKKDSNGHRRKIVYVDVSGNEVVSTFLLPKVNRSVHISILF